MLLLIDESLSVLFTGVSRLGWLGRGKVPETSCSSGAACLDTLGFRRRGPNLGFELITEYLGSAMIAWRRLLKSILSVGSWENELMVKQAGRKGARGPFYPPPPPRLKQFRPMNWYSGYMVRAVGEYVSHLLRELGRLGLEVHDIERFDRPPNTKTVLSDLIDWLSERPGEAFAKLFNWQTLDFAQLRSRIEKDHAAKPRIEVSAHITKMNNLSVRWHPGGWSSTDFDWQRSDHHHFNLITHRKWREPPDFDWFVGDEDPTFDSRPSNELMYIRGVGNLHPEPRDSYGPYATYNADVVDAILICAVRSAYEGLIKQLKYNFDVTVIDGFDFAMREEIDETASSSSYRSSVRRVVAWTLEDAIELQARRERDAAAEQEKRDQAEFAGVATTYGFSPESLVAALLRASSRKPTGPAPSGEHVNRNAAKDLRNAGFKVDAGNVRRIRQLIARYSPEILPEELRRAPVDASPALSPPNNVVPIRGDESQ